MKLTGRPDLVEKTNAQKKNTQTQLQMDADIIWHRKALLSNSRNTFWVLFLLFLLYLCNLVAFGWSLHVPV